MSENAHRQVTLDLETTGLTDNNRIIEVGCVEVIGRNLTGREFHQYVNPEDCAIEEGAARIHGITREQLVDEPVFRDILDDLLDFVRDAEVLIHNASFDLGFLDAEMKRAERPGEFRDHCLEVTDTLVLARERSSGGSSLDQLCDFYRVDREERTLHGALLDARLLAQVYLRMTSEQMGLTLGARARRRRQAGAEETSVQAFISAEEDSQAHEEFLDLIETRCEAGRHCVWRHDQSAESASETQNAAAELMNE